MNNYRRHVEIVEALTGQDIAAMRAAIAHHYREGRPLSQHVEELRAKMAEQQSEQH